MSSKSGSSTSREPPYVALPVTPEGRYTGQGGAGMLLMLAARCSLLAARCVARAKPGEHGPTAADKAVPIGVETVH